MYDVEKLVSIVCDYLDAEADYMKYSLDARKELGLAPGSTLWIPSLNGSKAYRLGELSEKSGATGSILADICAMLARFLSNERGESGVYPWFSSTGRKKPWCE